MNGTTLLAAIILAVAAVAMLGGIVIARVDEGKLTRSRLRRFAIHPVTVAASAALAAGCLAGVVVLGVFTFAPSVTALATTPQLASSYSGSITNTTVAITASMALQSVKQSGAAIHGYFQVGQPLGGSGNFTGSVDAHRHVTFDVPNGSGSGAYDIKFTGDIAADGGISGAYVVHYQDGRPDEQGTWTVHPGTA